MDGDAGGGGVQSGPDEEPDGDGCVSAGGKGRQRSAHTRFEALTPASEKLKQKFRAQISSACQALQYLDANNGRIRASQVRVELAPAEVLQKPDAGIGYDWEVEIRNA